MSTLGEVTTQKHTIRNWASRHDRAVVLVADDKLSDDVIAAEVGIKRWQLDKWKRDPQFIEKLAEYREKVRAALIAKGIRDKENRLRNYNVITDKIMTVIEQRAADTNLTHVPGGSTGLIVAKPIMAKVYTEEAVELGDPENPEYVSDREYLAAVKRSVIEYEYAVDTGTLKELREVQKQAAIEVGEWNEKDGQKANALDVLTALAAFGRGEFDSPRPKQLPKATAATVAPDEDWGMPQP